jgi:8-oxo-dGTP diphosphatase
MNRISSSIASIERPLVTVDVVIFSVINEQLCVLMVRRPTSPEEPFPGLLAIPGGFIDVRQDASLMECARRKLQQKTGVVSPYLEQLGSWGGVLRDPRGWSCTHVYFALVTQQAELDGISDAQWVTCEQALGQKLAFDHGELLSCAIERLRSKVEYTSLPAFLLAEPFTLPQLQHVYEIILARPLDKSAFRRRMLDAGFLVESGVVTKEQGRPAASFCIRDRGQATLFPRTFKSAH